jgi:hypothetical protein
MQKRVFNSTVTRLPSPIRQTERLVVALRQYIWASSNATRRSNSTHRKSIRSCKRNCINPGALRANDFSGFFEDRRTALLSLVEQAMGKQAITTDQSAIEDAADAEDEDNDGEGWNISAAVTTGQRGELLRPRTTTRSYRLISLIVQQRSTPAYFALIRFANNRYAPGTPAGNCRNHEYEVKI